MSEIAFETGRRIIAASHEWAAKLDADYGSVERERMRVGYANGALAIAAERDRLREVNAQLLTALKAAKEQLDMLAPRADSSFRADFVKAWKQVDAAITKAEKG